MLSASPNPLRVLPWWLYLGLAARCRPDVPSGRVAQRLFAFFAFVLIALVSLPGRQKGGQNYFGTNGFSASPESPSTLPFPSGVPKFRVVAPQ